MLKEKIQNLKKEKGAVILAHYYTSKDVQEVTESGILVEMRKRFPEKDFIPAPPVHEATCNECNYMKMITLESILACLESETPEVLLDETIRAAAKRSIDNMISIR